jgi:hypothetical protein
MYAWECLHEALLIPFAGLVPGMYTREGKEVSNPDPASGLYIVDRNGRSVKVVIPPSHLAFQVGEAMQVRLYIELYSAVMSTPRPSSIQ